MFPEIDMDINLENIVETETLPTLGKVFLFNTDSYNHVIRDGKLVEASKLQAVKQWVDLCLITVKDKNEVYKDTEFGAKVEDLVIGHKLNDFYEIELKREIEEALLKNNMISSLLNIEISQDETNKRLYIVNLMIELFDGEIVEQEVNL